MSLEVQDVCAVDSTFVGEGRADGETPHPVRREANAPKSSPEWFMRRRARIDTERVLPTLKKNALGLPTFLLGGAVVSWVSTTLGQAALWETIGAAGKPPKDAARQFALVFAFLR